MKGKRNHTQNGISKFKMLKENLFKNRKWVQGFE